MNRELGSRQAGKLETREPKTESRCRKPQNNEQQNERKRGDGKNEKLGMNQYYLQTNVRGVFGGGVVPSSRESQGGSSQTQAMSS